MTHITVTSGTAEYILPIAFIYLTGERSSRINVVGGIGLDVTDAEYQRVKALLAVKEDKKVKSETK